MKTKKVRRCSLCKSTRHTKSKCQLHKHRRGSAPVVVRTTKKVSQSQHILSLGKKEDESIELPLFREKPASKIERRVVDFAALVSAHVQKNLQIKNEQKEERQAVIEVAPKIKKNRLSLFRLVRNHVTNLGESISTNINHLRLEIRKWFFSWGRVATVVCILLLVLPFPVFGYYRQIQQDGALIVSHSTDAFLSLQSSTVAALHTNVGQASSDLTDALASFATARALVEEKHGVLMSLVKLLPVVGSEVQTRESILVAGHNIALGNAYLVQGIASSQQEEEMPLTERITTFIYHIRGALPLYDDALKELLRVDVQTLPIEAQETFVELRILFGAFINDMHEVVSLVDGISGILGDDGVKTYLLVGQNSNELRPTGGFMGSMALISIQRGKIVRFEIPKGGTYDVQGQIQRSIKPPLPLQVVNKRWELQDANWFPDFPASAQKVISFYEDARRETVDGVIAVNASVLERLLSVLGPLSLRDGSELQQDTVISTLEYSIAQKREDGSAEPKAVLGDLVQELQKSLTKSNSTDVVRLLLTLSSALSQKDIQVYFNDTKLQEMVASFGWSGSIQQVGDEQDYLLVNVSNIGGGKSDSSIDQHVSYDVVVKDDGESYGMVTITREYRDSLVLHSTKPSNSYIRLYVPKGAQLLSASGFDFPSEELFVVPESWYEDDTDLASYEQEVGFDSISGTRITQEFGKTVFGNWLSLKPGEKKEVVLVYKLPFSIIQDKTEVDSQFSSLFNIKQKQASGYSLVIQKQSGIASPISFSLAYPAQWSPIWRSSEQIDLARNGVLFKSDLQEDKTIGVVLEKR